MKTSDELKRETQEELSKIGRRNRRFVHLVCSICHRECQIRTSNPELYTVEVKQKWTCFNCSCCRKRPTPVIVTQVESVKETSQTKVCPKCQQTKPRTEFGRDKSTGDGMYYICKVCTKQASLKKGGTDEKVPNM